MVFGVFDFLQKTNERIRLYYYDTSSRLVFVLFLEEIEDTKKTISKLSDLYEKTNNQGGCVVEGVASDPHDFSALHWS